MNGQIERGIPVQWSTIQQDATHVETSKTRCYMKKARHKRPRVALQCVHFYEMSRMGRSIGTESRLAVAWAVTTNGHEESY